MFFELKGLSGATKCDVLLLVNDTQLFSANILHFYLVIYKKGKCTVIFCNPRQFDGIIIAKNEIKDALDWGLAMWS